MGVAQLMPRSSSDVGACWECFAGGVDAAAGALASVGNKSGATAAADIISAANDGCRILKVSDFVIESGGGTVVALVIIDVAFNEACAWLTLFG